MADDSAKLMSDKTSLEQIAAILFRHGGMPVGRIQDPPQVVDHFAFHLFSGHMREGIAHQVEPAALPGHDGKARLAGFCQAGVCVARHQLDSIQPALDERLEELSSMDLRFGERNTHSQHAAASCSGPIRVLSRLGLKPLA
jgi:hypothetical protein